MRVYEIDASAYIPRFSISVTMGTDRSRKALRKMGFGDVDISHDMTTSRMVGDDSCHVSVADGFSKIDRDNQLALVAHEAVHCMTGWCESIGEDDPGEEVMAYMVQCCFKSILDGIEAERESGHDA